MTRIVDMSLSNRQAEVTILDVARETFRVSKEVAIYADILVGRKSQEKRRRVYGQLDGEKDAETSQKGLREGSTIVRSKTFRLAYTREKLSVQGLASTHVLKSVIVVAVVFASLAAS